MAVLVAQQAVNTRDLPELENVTGGAQAASNNTGGWYFSGIPAEVGFQYKGADSTYNTADDTYIHFFSSEGGTGNIDIAAQAVYQGIITGVEVKVGTNAHYSISNHASFDILDLYADALDNGELDTIPGQIFGGSDELNGSQFDDTLFAFNGADTIYGNEGDDEIDGGDGEDDITGGEGADEQTGGFNADTFIFLALTDSTKKASGRDTILDFNAMQGDTIDLEAIDARSGDGNPNSKFKFIGKKGFDEVKTKNKGELAYKVKNGDALLLGNTDKDDKAEFAILVNDVTKLSHTDFAL